MPRKIKRIGKNQTLLFVEESSKPVADDTILPEAWQTPVPKKKYREGSLADKMRKGLWFACPNCGTENIEFVSDAAWAWLCNKNQFKCPLCNKMVGLE